MDGFLLAGDFVLEENLEFVDVGKGYLGLVGRISCAGSIEISVKKLLLILSGEGSAAVVQNVYYSYSAVIRGLGTILRYDSPHLHRPMHHCHRYEVLNGDRDGRIDDVSLEEWPTLGEMIGEVRGWYYDHLDRLVGDPPTWT
jgi:hypothetical protein